IAEREAADAALRDLRQLRGYASAEALMAECQKLRAELDARGAEIAKTTAHITEREKFAAARELALQERERQTAARDRASEEALSAANELKSEYQIKLAKLKSVVTP